VIRYRATIYERLKTTRAFKAIAASKAYTTYQMLWPG
jgi:hypothetical protein